MRRFPPPPSRVFAAHPSGTATPDQSRSKVAPMQFEWQSPRIFPASSFLAGGAAAEQDEGERARKRTHYEAMDLDTPPRPSFPPPDLVPDSSARDPFHLLGSDSREAPVPSTSTLPVDPPAPAQTESIIDAVSDEAEPAMDGVVARRFEGERRRRGNGGGRRERSPTRQSRAARRDDDDGDDTAEEEGMSDFGGMAMRKGKGKFSFQVHHHHQGSSSAGGLTEPAKGKWLDRNTPYTLLGYLHFASVAVLLLLTLSLLLLLLHTLKTDITSRLSSLTLSIRAEILACAKSYVDNSCDAATRIPISEAACAEWERCMQQEVNVDGKTRVVVAVLAEVVDGFVEVISWRTMAFVTITLVTVIYGSSVALSLLPSPAPPAPHYSAQQGGPSFQHLGHQNTPSYLDDRGYRYSERQLGIGAPAQVLGKGKWL